MKPAVLFSILVMLSVIGCTKRQGSDIRSGMLTVLATESHLPLVQQLVADYHSVFPEVVVTPQGTTTRAAIVDMVNDSVHCVVVDRRLNEEERSAIESAKLKVIETEIASDGLAVLVHPSNRLSVISMETLKAILVGKTALWNTVPESKLHGVIELCLTGKNSGLYELLTRHFFKLKNDVSLAAMASSQQEIIEYVATHPEALGVVSFAAWKDTTHPANASAKKNVRPLDLLITSSEGVQTAVRLNQRNIYDQTYPLTYSLYIYTSEQRPGPAYGFSAFVAGETGQRVFLYAGLVPKTMPYRTIQLTQE
ncbi:MAG: substrate-binding domain-containing protein [Ignavibacteriales bacterium]|nr:substrate-binding domain-containing protein [Ignavibacteriales bacterium]